MKKFILAIMMTAVLNTTSFTLPLTNPGPKNKWAGVKSPIEKKGNNFLPTGYVFDAVLIYAILSYNLIVPAVAEVEEDQYYLGELVIPKGTQIIGSVQPIHTLSKITINFQTMVFPDGQEITFTGIALSIEDGSGGVTGKVEKHKDKIAAKIAMKSVFAAVSASAQLAAPGVEGAMVTGLSQEAMQSIDSEAGKTKVTESIYVSERTPVKVFTTRRVDY